MASVLPIKQQKVLVLSLEKQGCKLRRTKDGWLIQFPDGNGTTMHTSQSDKRSVMNLRASIKRAGLTWPFD